MQNNFDITLIRLGPGRIASVITNKTTKKYIVINGEEKKLFFKKQYYNKVICADSAACKKINPEPFTLSLMAIVQKKI